MKRLVAVVLIVSMIFTTGGFATLADSISDVVETTRRENVESKPHKYYDDLISENADTTSVGENTDTKGVNDDVGAKLSEPEEKEDEPSSNEYTEEPEVDETTASSDEEQDLMEKRQQPSTYCFDKEGNMVTGWVNTVDNKWYYLENVKTVREGMMVFGWYQVQNKWYYFTADGTMLANNITPDGYIVGTDGAWVQ